MIDDEAHQQQCPSNVINDEDLLRDQLVDEQERERIVRPAQLSEFQRNKLEKDAKKNWDLFYKRNGDRFFKNRYWTRHEFGELFGSDSNGAPDELDKCRQLKYILEIGCGCGNFILPLLDDDDISEATERGVIVGTARSIDDLFVYCTDISDVAIRILQSSPTYKRHQGSRIFAFPSDITQDIDSIKKNLDNRLMDFVSLIFVLSALDPTKMTHAIANVESLLKPGGLVLFRDYAIYDKAMLRFKEQSKISDQFYVRQDGTRAYFFSKNKLITLFEENNFVCQSIDYIRTETFNNATKDKYSRIFLQAKFRKKSSPSG